MRQAYSAIKGFVYQFDKSLIEILTSNENETIILEGQIEDIDIISDAGVETIRAVQATNIDIGITKLA